MSQSYDAVLKSEHPFALMVRSGDRDRLLTQLVAAASDSILDFPIRPQEDHDGLDHAPDALPALLRTARITGPAEGTVAMTCAASLTRQA